MARSSSIISIVRCSSMLAPLLHTSVGTGHDPTPGLLYQNIRHWCQIACQWQGHAKVGSAMGVAPRNPIFLLVVVRQCRTATSRETLLGEASPPRTHQMGFD